MAGATEDAEGAAFARTLSALKERGSNLLVVGTTYRRGHVAVCDRLLGSADVPRRRLLVRTDGECGMVPPGDDARVVTVEQRTPWHDPGVTSAGGDRPIPEGDIESLERTTLEELSDLVDSGVEAGELRLCVDSLRPLLVAHSESRVRRFVDSLGEHVDDADGIGHFHLPASNSDRYVSLLTPVVDAVVQVRTRQGESQQRWHVFDGAVDSGWLPL